MSKRRAQAAVKYIIDKGIDPDRITARGYGESQLIISDEDINKLPTETEREAAHQINRRTEFKILEYNKSEVEQDELAENPEEIDEMENAEEWEKEIEWDQ